MPSASAPPEPGPPLVLSLPELQARIEGFVTEFLDGKSPETIGTYRRTLNEFERWFVTQRGRFRFRETDVEAYKRYLMEERELSQVSVSTYLTALRRLCQYLVSTGELSENPAKGVKGNRRPSTHSRGVLTAEDVTRLFDAVEGDRLISLRDRALMALMVYGGLAEIELVRADREDLEQNLLGWFLRVQGKGHTAKDQQVPLDEPAIEALQAYLAARGRVRPEDPLFISHGHRSDGQRLNTRTVRSRVNTHLKEAELKRPGISPHSLTHTAPLIWLNDGMALEEVRQRMRHGTLDTTMIYFRKQGLLTRKPDAG
ncbi:MAG: tyrosine-type recombinase/integrase [Rhodothermaceae bacterium]|nr:tyrosine-type recombinase/integrase [Rhodothermaceae bacterium]